MIGFSGDDSWETQVVNCSSRRLGFVRWSGAMVLAVLMLWSTPARGDGPLRATIREDGTLLIDDRAVFPVAICPASYGGNLQHCAEVGFNMVVGSGDVPDEFYDLAAEAGLYVIGGHYVWATFAGHDESMNLFQHEKAGFDLAFGYRDQSQRRPLETLAKYDKHPAVIGWYVYEEPKANFSEPLEHMYELFKSQAPAHIVTGVSAEKIWYHHFYNTVDVLMVDCYPYRPGKRAQPEILTYELTRHAVEVMRGKPVWLMAQGGCQWKNWNEFPPMTEANYRNQALLGLIAGAKGYVLYSYPGVNHFGRLDEQAEQQQWAKIEKVVAELQKLGPIICDGRVSDHVRIAWKFENGRGVPPLTRVLEHYGKHYLLVANIGDKAVEADILGTNYGFPEAFAEVSVFCGSDGLQAQGVQEGESTQTVNESKTGQFPRIKIEPDSSGVFEIIRRPARPSKK